MSELFENLPEEKKKKIIDVCIEEFANNGYEKASTNSIVKKADISKGLLFHYFGSKKKVFLYTLDYTINYILKKYYARTDVKPCDLFDRMMWISILKMKMFHEEPVIFKFIFNAFVNIPNELKEDIKDRETKLKSEHMPNFFEGIDTSKIREGVDKIKAIEIITLFLEGLSNKYLNIFKGQSADEMFENMEKLIVEFNEYFDILKGGIYEE